MPSKIPVTIELTGQEFRALEQIAERNNTTMRELIAQHIGNSLNRPVASRTITAAGKPMQYADVEAWVTAAQMGVTNRTIAQRYGVTEQLVSRVLNERGVFRQKRRGE